MDNIELFKLQNIKLQLILRHQKFIGDKILYETLFTDGREFIKIEEWNNSRLSGYDINTVIFFKQVGFTVASMNPFYVRLNGRGNIFVYYC
jgi:hypothetical protein